MHNTSTSHALHSKMRRSSHRGFNLIEVTLSMTFFAFAFAATMLGAQSMALANMNATRLQEENNAVNGLIHSIDFHNPDVEVRYDVSSTKSSLALNNNQKTLYTLNVYSEPLYPDIKIADVALYRSPNATTAYRHIRKTFNLMNECHNYGATELTQAGDIPCTPLHVGNAGTYTSMLTTNPGLSRTNYAYASTTSYTAPGGGIATQQGGGTTSFNPEVDNVWSGIQSAGGAGGTGNMFDFNATAYTNGSALSDVQKTGYQFNRGSFFGDGSNLRILMPASSGAFGAANTTTAYRYTLEVGTVVATSGYKIRVIPLASNASDITKGVGYLDFPATANNQALTIRVDNMRPYHDPVSDRPHIGVAIQYVDSTGSTQRVEDPKITHVIKRPYVGG
jgi:hypothetical protein